MSSSNNDINDVIFTGSPLDEYLQALISNNDTVNNINNGDNQPNDLLSEMLQCEDSSSQDLINQYQSITTQQTVSNNIAQSTSVTLKDLDYRTAHIIDDDNSKNDNSVNINNNVNLENNYSNDVVIKDENNNDIYSYFMNQIYNAYSRFRTTILESNILHPLESPFINPSLVSLDLPPPPPSQPTYSDFNSLNLDFNLFIKYIIYNNTIPTYYNTTTIGLLSISILFISFLLNSNHFILLFILLLFISFYIYRLYTKISRDVELLNQQNKSIQGKLENSFKVIDTQLDIITKSIKLIREVELISKGYRFSSPLIPIERIEINKDKSEKSLVLRASITKVLRSSTLQYKQDLDKFANQYLDNQYRDAYLKSDDLNSNFYISNNNEQHDNSSAARSSQEEIDSQLPILTIKSMFQQYQIIISNYYTVIMLVLADQNSWSKNEKGIEKVLNLNQCLEQSLDKLFQSTKFETVALKNIISNESLENKIPNRIILNRPKKTILESFLYNNNQMLESMTSSINPMLKKINGIILPLTNKKNNNNSETDNNEENDGNNSNNEIDIDLVTLDDIVNDFLTIKNELSNSLKYWEMSNRTLIRMVMSIDRNLPEMTEEESKQRIQRLIESLRKSTANYDEFDQDDDNNSKRNDSNRQYIDLSSIIRDPLDDDSIFEAYTGPLEEEDPDELEFYKQLQEQQIQQQQPQPSEQDSSNTGGPPPPPPPPPLPADGKIPKKKNPPKRTVYDPEFDTEKQQPKKRQPTTYSVLLPVVPPEKKVINELKSVLDVIVVNKENKKKTNNSNNDQLPDTNPKIDSNQD